MTLLPWPQPNDVLLRAAPFKRGSTRLDPGQPKLVAAPTSNVRGKASDFPRLCWTTGPQAAASTTTTQGPHPHTLCSPESIIEGARRAVLAAKGPLCSVRPATGCVSLTLPCSADQSLPAFRSRPTGGNDAGEGLTGPDAVARKEKDTRVLERAEWLSDGSVAGQIDPSVTKGKAPLCPIICQGMIAVYRVACRAAGALRCSQLAGPVNHTARQDTSIHGHLGFKRQCADKQRRRSPHLLCSSLFFSDS